MEAVGALAKIKVDELVKDRRFTLKEIVLMNLGRPVYLEDRMREGWVKPLPHYVFRCPVHGYVVDYPHGYGERLECPLCRQENLPDGLDYRIYPSKEHEGL